MMYIRKPTKYISRRQLVQMEACGTSTVRFASLWPVKAEVTHKNVITALNGSLGTDDLRFLAENFFQAANRHDYKECIHNNLTRFWIEMDKLAVKDRRRRSERDFANHTAKYYEEREALITDQRKDIARIFMKYWRRAIKNWEPKA